LSKKGPIGELCAGEEIKELTPKLTVGERILAVEYNTIYVKI